MKKVQDALRSIGDHDGLSSYHNPHPITQQFTQADVPALLQIACDYGTEILFVCLCIVNCSIFYPQNAKPWTAADTNPDAHIWAAPMHALHALTRLNSEQGAAVLVKRALWQTEPRSAISGDQMTEWFSEVYKMDMSLWIDIFIDKFLVTLSSI